MRHVFKGRLHPCLYLQLDPDQNPEDTFTKSNKFEDGKFKNVLDKIKTDFKIKNNQPTHDDEFDKIKIELITMKRGKKLNVKENKCLTNCLRLNARKST